MPRLLSVLIPAFNEERTIDAILDQVLAFDARPLGFTLEVIVCDDGSSDATALRVAARAATEPRLRLVRHAQNRGKGAAIRTALGQARGHYTLVQDADLEYSVADYAPLLRATQGGAPVIFGSRFLTRRWPTGMALPNWVCNRVLTLTANLLYGLRITDEATCFKLFDTELLRSLELEASGFDFCPEVTAKVGRRGVPIVEVPIAYVARGASDGKKIRWTDGVRAFQVLLAQRTRRLPTLAAASVVAVVAPAAADAERAAQRAA